MSVLAVLASTLTIAACYEKVGVALDFAEDFKFLSASLSSEPKVTLLLVSSSTTALDIDQWIDTEGVLFLYDLTKIATAKYLVRSAAYRHSLQTFRSQATPTKGFSECVTTFIRRLDFESFVYLYSTEYALTFEVAHTAMTITEDITDTSLKSLVSRGVRTQGERGIVVAADGQLGVRVIKALIKGKLVREGFVVIAVTRLAGDFKTIPKSQGLLTLTLQGNENLKAFIETEELNIRRLILNTAAYSPATDDRDIVMLNNNQTNSTSLVGTNASGGFRVTRAIVYPGGGTSPPTDTKIKIRVSMNSGSSNPGNTTDPYNSIYFRGAHLAFESAKTDNFLDKWEVELHETDCGATVFDANFTTNCFKREKNQLGVAFMSTFSSEVTVNGYKVMQSLNITTPNVGSAATSASLSDPKKFSRFVRIVSSSNMMANSYMLFLRQYKYTRVNLVYSNETFGRGFGAYMTSVIEAAGIEIVNSEASRAVPIDMANTFNSSDPSHTLPANEVLASQIRPLIALLSFPYKVPLFSSLKNAGLSKEDLVIIEHGSYKASFEDLDEQSKAELVDLLEGQLYVYYSAYVGSLGQEVKESLFSKYAYNATESECLHYDGAKFILTALKAALLRGEDYEDSAVMLSELRKARFTGCSGYIAISSDSNDRREVAADLNNLIRQGEDFIENKVMTILFTSSHPITVHDSIKWPDGSELVPKINRLNYEDCPFPEEYRHNFDEGTVLEYAALLAFAGVSVCIGILLFWRLQRTEREISETDRESLIDIIMQYLVFLEAMQLCYKGPSFDSFFASGTTFLSLSCFGFTEIIDADQEGYWSAVYLAITGIGFMVLCSLFLWLKQLSCRVNETIEDFSSIFVPVLGSLCLLPFVSVFLDIFICTQAAGPDKDNLDYSDSFLMRDCNESCWEGRHLTYIVITSFIIPLLQAALTLALTMWQIQEDTLHIVVHPKFLALKLTFRVLVAVIGTLLRKDFILLHAGLFYAIVVTELVLTLKFKPFNYSRTNLWHSVTLSIVLVFALFAILEDYFPLNTLVWTISTVACAGALIIAAIMVQKLRLPSTFREPPKVNTGAIFNFAFKFNQQVPSCMKKYEVASFFRPSMD
jgi:ABC-type branched-subunit amino acid transport system substrate-binding protein